MTYLTRWQIQRLTDRNGTEFYSEFAGSDDWTTDERDAVEFSTRARAERRADRVGGEVIEFQRPATAFETMMLARPTHIQLIAAE